MSRSIIFCPLDIPEPPKVDRDVLTDWIHRWYDACFYTKAELYKQKVPEGYPWKVGQPFRDPTDGIPPSQIELDLRQEFLDKFPELTAYFKTAFPLEFTGATFLLQQHNQDVEGHTDSDYGWAPRCYLWNDYQEEALWFRIPNDLTERVKINTLIRNKDYTGYGEPLYAKFPKKEYLAWTFNAAKSIHGVIGTNKLNASRCTIIIRGKINVEQWNQMLERSYKKYSEYVIWI